MSGSITAAFIKKYSDDVTHLASQKASKLMGQTRLHRNVGGSTYDFHRMAGLTAATRAAGSSADVTGLDATSTVVTATLADYEVPIYAQKFDQLKTNVDQVKEYQVETVAAINRQIDSTIITALNASANTVGGAAAAFSFAKIQAVLTQFNTNDVDEENRVIVIAPQTLSELLAIDKFTNADYNSIQTLMNARIGQFLGMTWIVHSALPKASTTRTIFAYDKKSVGVAMGKDVSTEINYVPHKVSHLINTTVSLGAVIIDPVGVMKVSLTES